MALYEDERLAISVRYIASRREIEINLDDGSRHLIPVDSLERVESVSNAYVPIAHPTDAQLSDVKVWGGGSAIYWESLDFCQ